MERRRRAAHLGDAVGDEPQGREATVFTFTGEKLEDLPSKGPIVHIRLEITKLYLEAVGCTGGCAQCDRNLKGGAARGGL